MRTWWGLADCPCLSLALSQPGPCYTSADITIRYCAQCPHNQASAAWHTSAHGSLDQLENVNHTSTNINLLSSHYSLKLGNYPGMALWQDQDIFYISPPVIRRLFILTIHILVLCFINMISKPGNEVMIFSLRLEDANMLRAARWLACLSWESWSGHSLPRLWSSYPSNMSPHMTDTDTAVCFIFCLVKSSRVNDN